MIPRFSLAYTSSRSGAKISEADMLQLLHQKYEMEVLCHPSILHITKRHRRMIREKGTESSARKSALKKCRRCSGGGYFFLNPDDLNGLLTAGTI